MFGESDGRQRDAVSHLFLGSIKLEFIFPSGISERELFCQVGLVILS